MTGLEFELRGVPHSIAELVAGESLPRISFRGISQGPIFPSDEEVMDELLTVCQHCEWAAVGHNARTLLSRSEEHEWENPGHAVFWADDYRGGEDRP